MNNIQLLEKCESRSEISELNGPTEDLKFIWAGRSTLLLNVEGKILLIDPVFSDFVSPVDVILISHADDEHIDKNMLVHYREKDTTFIVVKGLGSHLYQWGIPSSRICELDLHEELTHLGLHFTTAPVKQLAGKFVSWIIQGINQKIFYGSDSGYGEHFREIGDKYGPFDVTFIENGEYDDSWRDTHMRPEETIQAHLDLNGNLLVPLHWGMFDSATYTIAKNWEIPMYIPKIGELQTLEGLFNTMNYHSR